MPFNTRNPIPSGDLRDLDDNARNIDTWANDKTKLSHPDRFGVSRRTWHGIEQEAKLNIQQAIDAKNAAQEAAMMSGFSKYADTLAQLEAGIGTDYVEGDVVMVFQDESRGDTSSIFKIESGAAEFKLTFDKTRQDLLSFTGTISADAEWSDVPAHSDPAFDVQAQALADRTEFIAQELTQPSGNEPVGGFADYSALAAYSGDATRVKVLGLMGLSKPRITGYFTRRDDLKGVYTESNSGTIIIDALGRPWLRDGAQGGRARFEWFGCVLDGVTDDTAAFKRAIKAHKSFDFDGVLKLTEGIDIDEYKTGQVFGLDIRGSSLINSVISFSGVSRGFYSSSDGFFRNLYLTNLSVDNANNNKTGIGLHIGVGGAEQISVKNVRWSGWKIGRAVHCWNSEFDTETFRYCYHAYTIYGTSSPTKASYAHSCDVPYLLGYAAAADGTVSVPGLPFAYTDITSHAADYCGDGGSIYKFGRCSGITLISPSFEIATGPSVFDFSQLVSASYTSVLISNFAAYITTDNAALTSVIVSPPAGNSAQVIFDGMALTIDKPAIVLATSGGRGVKFRNPRANPRGFAALATSGEGVVVDGVAYGADTASDLEIGVGLPGFRLIKKRKGFALVNAASQKVRFYGGSASEGIAQGLMFCVKATLMPLNKSNVSGQKAGELLFSVAADYNYTGAENHETLVRTGTLTAATTLTRVLSITGQWVFDLNIEVTGSTTIYAVDLEITYNGIDRTGNKSWEVLTK